MSDTTKTPRAHAVLAALYMADSSLKCWSWSADAEQWAFRQRPIWHEDMIYHVGHEKPTAPPKPPKRKVTIAGITFDAPETEAPKLGAKCWVTNLETTYYFEWSGGQVERRWLAAGRVHLDKENARLHAQALRELNRQLCGLGGAQ